jgi:hypothetical protein
MQSFFIADKKKTWLINLHKRTLWMTSLLNSHWRQTKHRITFESCIISSGYILYNVYFKKLTQTLLTIKYNPWKALLPFNKVFPLQNLLSQGVTKRFRLSVLTNSGLFYESQYGGWGGGWGVSANEYSCAHGAQINFGDLPSYLTYVLNLSVMS